MRHIKLLILSVFFVFSALAGHTAEKQSAYIAAAVEGPSGSALLSGVAARAPYYIFYDKSGRVTESIQNPFRSQQAAGPRLTEFLVSKGVKIFIAESFGNGRMPALLTSRGVTLKESKGTADDAVKQLIKK